MAQNRYAIVARDIVFGLNRKITRKIKTLSEIRVVFVHRGATKILGY